MRSVTWQKQGNAWCKQLIVLYRGVLEQHTLSEPDLLPFPAASPLADLGYSDDHLGESVPGGPAHINPTFPLSDAPLSHCSSSVAPVIFLLIHSSDLLKENLFNSG